MPDYKIFKKSQLWKLIPLAGRNRFSTTLSDKIYLTPERYDDWKSESPKKSTIALVAHEQVHVDQYRRDPAFKRRYLTSRKWRLQYEAEAYAKQAFMRVKLGSSRVRHDYVSRYAKILASRTYMLFLSFDEVYEAIDKAYSRLVSLAKT